MLPNSSDQFIRICQTRIRYDSFSKLAKALSDCHKDNIQVLNIIHKELIPNCKHPKKIRDKSADRQLYCISSNLDLSVSK